MYFDGCKKKQKEHIKNENKQMHWILNRKKGEKMKTSLKNKAFHQKNCEWKKTVSYVLVYSKWLLEFKISIECNLQSFIRNAKAKLNHTKFDNPVEM